MIASTQITKNEILAFIAVLVFDDDDDELFCGMVDQQKAFSPLSSGHHCWRSSPSRISDTS